MVSPVVSPGLSLNTPSTLEPALVGLATCPLCHTEHASMTKLAVSAGADWHCSRCGWRWDAGRLATVAAYACWLAERAAASTITCEPIMNADAAPIAQERRLLRGPGFTQGEVPART